MIEEVIIHGALWREVWNRRGENEEQTADLGGVDAGDAWLCPAHVQ